MTSTVIVVQVLLNFIREKSDGLNSASPCCFHRGKLNPDMLEVNDNIPSCSLESEFTGCLFTLGGKFVSQINTKVG